MEGGKKLLSSMKDKDGTETTDKTNITQVIDTFTEVYIAPTSQIGERSKIGRSKQRRCHQ